MDNVTILKWCAIAVIPKAALLIDASIGGCIDTGFGRDCSPAIGVEADGSVIIPCDYICLMQSHSDAAVFHATEVRVVSAWALLLLAKVGVGRMVASRYFHCNRK